MLYLHGELSSIMFLNIQHALLKRPSEMQNSVRLFEVRGFELPQLSRTNESSRGYVTAKQNSRDQRSCRHSGRCYQQEVYRVVDYKEVYYHDVWDAEFSTKSPVCSGGLKSRRDLDWGLTRREMESYQTCVHRQSVKTCAMKYTPTTMVDKAVGGRGDTLE
jgi:hypothetical protein